MRQVPYAAALLIAAIGAAPAAPAPQGDLVEIQHERGAEWSLSCVERDFKVDRSCTVAQPIGGEGRCTFSVVVAKAGTYLRLACAKPVSQLGLRVDDARPQTFEAPDDKTLAIAAGTPGVVDPVLTALRFAKGRVRVEVTPVEGEVFSKDLGSRDFDRMQALALVVADP